MPYAQITSILPSTKYSLNEVVDQHLIPGVDSYPTIYNLVTTKRVQIGNKKLYKNRSLEQITSAKSIRAFHDGKAWGKIKGKIYVEGKEIIEFRKINHLF